MTPFINIFLFCSSSRENLSDQVKLQPACSANETSFRLEISGLGHEYQICYLNWANAQAALHLCRVQMAYTGFLMKRLFRY